MSMEGSDQTLKVKVTNLANALEDAALNLAKGEPLDTSKINAAVNEFDSKQDKISALCSAVKQVNPRDHAANPMTVPPLDIGTEIATTHWASLHIYSDFSDSLEKNKIHRETVYIMPITPDEARDIGNHCQMLPHVDLQANAKSVGGDTDNGSHN